MNYTLTSLPKSEVEVLVTIPFFEFEPHIHRAASAISEEIEIEGFRRGKAPFDVIKNKVGELRVYERAAEFAVRKTYPDLLEKISEEEKKKGKEFIPLGRPEVSITKLALGNDLEYKVKISLLPEVILPDYKSIAQEHRKDQKEVKLEEEEVEKTVSWIRESRSQFITVDRPAGEGDAVEIDFEIRQGGVKIEQGESQNHPLIIGKGKFIPGFEKELIGMRAGEEKFFTLPAPPDWHDKSVAGKALDVKTSIRVVQEVKLPELNDDFAKTLGNFSSVDELKRNIRRGILQEKKEKESQRIRALIIDDIASKSETNVPEVLVDSELEKMLAELKSGVENMGMKWDDYLTHIKKNKDDLRKEWRKDAQRRVKQALALRAIAQQEKITVTEEEVEARANQFLRQFGSPEEVTGAIDPEELREYTKGVLRNEKVFELLEKF